MKRKMLYIISVATLFLLYTNHIVAQNVGINDDGSTPEASAILHLKSASGDKGLLIPEVNLTDLTMAAPVTTPAEGLLVYNTNTTTGKGFHYWDGTEWLLLQKGTDIGTFENTTSVVHNAGNDTTDDFVFGSPQLDDDGNVGHRARFFFDKSKRAFRAGYVINEWDAGNIGSYSIAMGIYTIASGTASTAIGQLTEAIGESSTAMGRSTTASGDYSTSMGGFTTASGNWSSSMGSSTTASGDYSTAMGRLTTASGLSSIAMGRSVLVSGDYSTAMGYQTTVSGDYATAMGQNTTAASYATTAIGRYNIGSGTASSWVETDPLLEVGNGTSSSNTSNALTVYKNGKVEINSAYVLPNVDGASGQVLSTDGSGEVSWQPDLGTFENTSNVVHNAGDDGQDDFVFGSPQLDGDGNVDHRARFFFDKSKGAFRAGYATNQWDAGSIGNNSTAMGLSTTASGYRSTAMGTITTASGDNSTAMGNNTTASGTYSTAMGFSNTASGYASTAMGRYTTASEYASTAIGSNTTASGKYSTAMGYHTVAASYGSTAIGRYNIGSGTAGSWVDTDPLLEVGNGTSLGNKSNALTVLKNGNVGIGMMPNANKLAVDGEASKATAGDWLANSDARLKKNIHPLQSESTLQKMLALQGVTYEWNDTKTGYDRPLGIQYGFTAQNIQAVFPELVTEDNLGYLQTAYGTYDAMYIEALRALNDKIEKLEKENTSLQEQVDEIGTMKAELERIKTMLKGNQEQ